MAMIKVNGRIYWNCISEGYVCDLTNSKTQTILLVLKHTILQLCLKVKRFSELLEE